MDATHTAPTEASGTVGWYHPTTGVEIGTDRPAQEHTGIVRDHPEMFGLIQADLDELDDREGVHQHDLARDWNPTLLDRVLADGWVRVNHTRGLRRYVMREVLYIHAVDLVIARQGALHYVVEHEWSPDEITVDIGPDGASKYFILDRDEWPGWTRKGKLPVHALRSLHEDAA